MTKINEAIFEVISTRYSDTELQETKAFKFVRKCGYIIGLVTLHPEWEEPYQTYAVESRKTHKTIWAIPYRDEPDRFAIVPGIFCHSIKVGERVDVDLANFLDTPERPYIEDRSDYRPTLEKYKNLQNIRRKISIYRDRIDNAERDLERAKEDLKSNKKSLKEQEKQLERLLIKYNLN